MISTAPNWGEGVGLRSSVGMLAAAFRPFVQKNLSIVSSPFLEKLPFLFFQYSSHTLSFETVIANN